MFCVGLFRRRVCSFCDGWFWVVVGIKGVNGWLWDENVFGYLLV